MFLVVFFIIVSAILLKSAIKIVPSGAAGVLFRMGKFIGVLTGGLHFSMPFLDRLFILNPGQPGVMISERLCSFDDIQAPVISPEKLKAVDPVKIGKIDRAGIFVVLEVLNQK